jgi:E3 ubiquitin-protein ligase DOA10
MVLGTRQEGDELIATYLSTYPIFMIVVGVVSGFVFAKRAVDKWRDSVRDEIYLVGEVLHNLDEER